MIRGWPLLALILSVHLIFLVSTRFTLWPEMVVYPYLLNNGFPLYRDIINPYMPSFIYLLALLEKLSTSTPIYFQAFSWAVIIAIDVLIFAIAKKLTGKVRDALLAAAFFAVVSIPFSVNNLWFDLVQTPPVILSVYFFYRFLKNPRDKNALFASSLFVTIAFFIKQQAAWLLIYFLLVLIFRFGKKTATIIMAQPKILAPAIIISLLHILFFAKINLLSDFLFWTVYFPLFLASSLPGYLLLPNVRQILPVAALLLTFTPLLFSKKNDLKFFALTAFSLLFFAYPRFDYFHLIPTVSILSTVAGENLNQLFRSRKLWAPKVAVSILSMFILVAFTARYFSRNWTGDVRFFENEIYMTADLIRKITTVSEPVYIQNGPDQILPLAGRLPTKPWADEFPWYLELNRTQDKVLEGIKSESPRFVVFKPYEQGSEFQIGAYRPDKIATYLDENYQNLIQINDFFWLKIKK